jgi:hypothetical protein
MGKTNKTIQLKRDIAEAVTSLPAPSLVGCPSDYKPQYALIAKRMGLLGLTIEHIAKFFDVPVSTVFNWRDNHPELLDALKYSRDYADSEVAESLFNRANGFTRKYVEPVVLKTGEIIDVEKEQYYPPDTTAQIFWLKNRQPDLWRDKREYTVKVDLSLAERMNSVIQGDIIDVEPE